MSQDKIGYALWMVRSAAKQAAVSTTAGASMMLIDFILIRAVVTAFFSNRMTPVSCHKTP